VCPPPFFTPTLEGGGWVTSPPPPPPPFYPRERTTVPIEWEVGWVPGPAWDVLEKRKILSIGIRTADRPGCSVVPLPTILPRIHVCCVMYIINKLVLFFVRGSATCIFRIIRVFFYYPCTPPLPRIIQSTRCFGYLLSVSFHLRFIVG